MRLVKSYLCPILVEQFSAILKAEVTLNQEGLELSGVHAIKGVQFMDFGMGRRGLVGLSGETGEVVDGEGKIVEDH